MTALEQLEALHERLRQAEAGVATATSERARAPRVFAQAKAALHGYYAAVDDGAEPDVELERKLESTVRRLETGVELSPLGNGMNTERHLLADERLLKAQLKRDEAHQALLGFRTANAEALALELVARAREVAKRYRPAALQIAALEREYHDVLASWREMLEPLGLTIDHLPESPGHSSRFAVVMPPMPRPLMRPEEMTPLARVEAEAAERERRLLEARRQNAADLAAEREAAMAAGAATEAATA